MGCANEMKISQGFDVHGKLKFHRMVYKNHRRKLYWTKNENVNYTNGIWSVSIKKYKELFW